MKRENENFIKNHFSFGEILAREERIKNDLRHSKEHEETNDSWRRFAGSGKIGDYLEYLRESTGEGVSLPKMK